MISRELDDTDQLRVEHRTYVSADGETRQAVSYLDEPLVATEAGRDELRANGDDPDEYLESLRQDSIAKHNALLAEVTAEAEKGLDLRSVVGFMERRGLSPCDWLVLDGIDAYESLRARHPFLPELKNDGGTYVEVADVAIIIRDRAFEQEREAHDGDHQTEHAMAHEWFHGTGAATFAGLDWRGRPIFEHGFIDAEHPGNNALEETVTELVSFLYMLEHRLGRPAEAAEIGGNARRLIIDENYGVRAYKYGISLLGRVMEHQPDVLDLIFASRTSPEARQELRRRLDMVVPGMYVSMQDTQPYTAEAALRLRRLDIQAQMYFARQKGLPRLRLLGQLFRARVAEYRASQSFTVTIPSDS